MDLLEAIGKEPLEGRPVERDLKGKLFPPVPAVPHATPSARSATTTTQASIEDMDGPQIHIPEPHLTPMLSLLRSYKLVQSLGLLHTIPYTTVADYLFFLRGVSRVMGGARDHDGVALGRRGMYYLAAAVSDFFIPRQRMVCPANLMTIVIGTNADNQTVGT